MDLLNLFSEPPTRLIKNILKDKGIDEIVKETSDVLHFRKVINLNESGEDLKNLPIDIIIDFPISNKKTGKKTVFNMVFFLPMSANKESRHFYESFCNMANNFQFFGGCFFIDLEFNRIAFRNAGQMGDKSILEQEVSRILSEGVISISTFLDMYFNDSLVKNEIEN